MRHSVQRPRAGMSLIEVMIAITILALILASLAALSFQVARRSLGVGGSTARNALMSRYANEFLTLAWADLPAPAAEQMVAAPNGAPYQIRTLVTDSAGPVSTVRTIRVVVAAVGLPVKPDTQYVQRTNRRSGPFLQ